MLAKGGCQALREAVAAIEQRGGAATTDAGTLPTGWDALALERGCLHEWLGVQDEGRWRPPLAILAHLAGQASDADASGRTIAWIGRHCWIAPRALIRGRDDRSLLYRSLFIDPPSAGERLWAIDVTLRSAGVCAVVADARGLPMSASRRLQLASQEGCALALLTRPASEARAQSAARTRWMVHWEKAEAPGWRIELLRRKGVRPKTEGARRRVVQRDHEAGIVGVVSPVPDRRVASAPARASA
jgi:protein ImuA